MDNKLKEKLKGANTLNQVIEAVNKEYNLDSPLGFLSKALVVEGITKLVKTLNVPKRTTIKKP